jgi:hypothetical protein
VVGFFFLRREFSDPSHDVFVDGPLFSNRIDQHGKLDLERYETVRWAVSLTCTAFTWRTQSRRVNRPVAP